MSNFLFYNNNKIIYLILLIMTIHTYNDIYSVYKNKINKSLFLLIKLSKIEYFLIFIILTIFLYFLLKINIFIVYVVAYNIFNIILFIVFILIGGVIPLLERKYLSLIQRRVGPKFVGYNGRLQFIADAMKLLLKELILLNGTNKFIMIILPIFTLCINLILFLNLVFLNSINMFDNMYFLFWVLIVELITVVFLTYIGFLVKNKYTIIASMRLLSGMIVFELYTTIIYLFIYIFYNKVTLYGVLIINTVFSKILFFILLSPFLLNFVLILLKKVPYDIIEAETELIMGYSTEHSGFLSGALLLIEYLHMFLWSYIYIYYFVVF